MAIHASHVLALVFVLPYLVVNVGGEVLLSEGQMAIFLKKYGWLDRKYDPLSTTSTGSESRCAAGDHSLDCSDAADETVSPLMIAINEYKQAHNLTSDEEVSKLMVTPRCGVADFPEVALNDGAHIVSRFSYYPNLTTTDPNDWNKWNKTHLTWMIYSHFVPSEWTIDLKLVVPIIKRCFDRWANISHFTFEYIPNTSKADIEFSMFIKAHLCFQPFDGPGGTLGHAFAPMKPYAHFDAEEDWNAGDSEIGKNQIDFESVATHEIGHILGLDHSADKTAKMNPYQLPGIRNPDLAQDDIIGLQKLYGWQREHNLQHHHNHNHVM